jgi:exo-1,4-beta-D-glucosaminidase
MTALNSLPAAPLTVTGQRSVDGAGRDEVTIRLTNPTPRIAFFARAELTATRGGDEILPITYDDNYVTVFPGETVEVKSVLSSPLVSANWVRVTPYDAAAVEVPVTPIQPR